VFDGTKEGAYREDDHVNPLSVYGRSKLAGEEAVRKLCPRHAIVRTSWVFSRHGNNFVKTMLRLGAQRDELGVVKDQTGAPTSARDIAHAIATIVGAIAAGAGEWGTFHFASAEPTSWFGFAQAIFAAARPQKSIKVLPITSEQFGAPARRPANSVLDCTRIHEAFGIERPSWDAALEETLAELAREGAPS
jgi:dTDP-4-dehydrorhamnose reductase